MDIEAPTLAQIAAAVPELGKPLPPLRMIDHGKLLKLDPVSVYELESVSPYEHGSFFTRQRLFLARSAGVGILPWPALPYGSWGIVSYDGQSVHFLRSLASLSQALRLEARPLDEAQPEDLCWLLCDMISHERCCGHEVLTRPEDAEGLPNHELDASVWDRARGLVTRPNVQRVEAGWTVRCTTLYGWMHETQQLGLETFHAGFDFSITRAQRHVLCDRLYLQLPNIDY